MIVVRESGAHCDPGSCGTGGGGAATALVFLAIVTAVTAAIAARAAIVSVAPATAAAYVTLCMPVNLRGLSINGVHAKIAELSKDR